MSDPIRDALRVAAVARCSCATTVRMDGSRGCAVPPPVCVARAAATIAAFLRALPDQYSRGGAAFWDAMPAEEETRLWLAAAVERVARGDA